MYRIMRERIYPTTFSIHAGNTSRLCFLICFIPVNTKHLYNMFTMVDQRRRRWSDIVNMLYKCFVFAGYITLAKHDTHIIIFVSKIL